MQLDKAVWKRAEITVIKDKLYLRLDDGVIIAFDKRSGTIVDDGRKAV